MGVLAEFQDVRFAIPARKFVEAERAFKTFVKRQPREVYDAGAVLAASGFLKTLSAAHWKPTLENGDISELHFKGDKVPSRASDFWPDSMMAVLAKFANRDSRGSFWSEDDPWVTRSYDVRGGVARVDRRINDAFDFHFRERSKGKRAPIIDFDDERTVLTVEYQPGLRIEFELNVVAEPVLYDVDQVTASFEVKSEQPNARLTLPKKKLKIGSSHIVAVQFGSKSEAKFKSEVDAELQERLEKLGTKRFNELSKRNVIRPRTTGYSFRVTAIHHFPASAIARKLPMPSPKNAWASKWLTLYVSYPR